MANDHDYPVRVLHVVGRMHRAGIETFIMNLYRHVDRTKVQFDFLTHYGVEADYNDEIRALGGRIYDMPKIKDGDSVYYGQLFKYKTALKDFFTQHEGEYVAVHGHLTQLAAIYFPIAKRIGKVPCLIAHSHSSRSKSGLVSLATWMLHLPVRFMATDMFACSQAAAEWIYSKSDIESGKVKLINNAIDVDKFTYSVERRIRMREELGLNDELILCHCGRFETVKNQRRLVDVFRVIHERNPNTALLLIGDGPDRPKIEAETAALECADNVRFLGVREDIPDLFAASDVFVMPSIYEGLPLTGIEAQASGLPCVLSDGITREADVSGNVAFVSLDSSNDEWADLIFAQAEHERTDARAMVRSAGYDVAQTAKELELFYLSIPERC